MKRLAVVVTALLVLGVAGTALASGTLSGKYKIVIKNDSALGGGLNGTWVLRLRHGIYHVTDNGKAEVNGTFKIKGHTITLKDTGGPGKCSGSGKYTFKLTGKRVRFKLVSDPSSSCVGRRAVLTHGAFTKV
jgi:hypothetical protein